jgi:hypothetical protein
LNFSNMNQIIAQRPTIQLEFGLEIPTMQASWNSVQNYKWSDLRPHGITCHLMKLLQLLSGYPMGTYYLDSWKNDVGRGYGYFNCS